MHNKEYWIEKLDLQPHPEGGYFKETYRSELMDSFEEINGIRNVSTGIYFLLTKGNFSAFHRIKSDEMWHFYDGSPVSIHVIEPQGRRYQIKLGLDAENGELPQAVVPAGCWFASMVEMGEYSLTGCAVAPGFDFQDFELAQRDELTKLYPQHELIVQELTRFD